MIRAFCFHTGAIGFGRDIPAGATVIARAENRETLQDFISSHAQTAGPPKKAYLVVPGMGAADNDILRQQALIAWSKWIAASAPRDVRVLSR